MTYIWVSLGLHVLRIMGPYPMTIRECDSKVELWVKFYMVDAPAPALTFQCHAYATKGKRI